MVAHRVISRRVASLLWIGSASLWTAGACGGAEVTPPVDTETPDTVVSSIRILPCACYAPWPCGCYSHSGGLSPERPIGVLGTKVMIAAAALAKDGTLLYRSTENANRFSWSSSAPDVATVGLNQWEQIQVTGGGEGKATITVTTRGVTGQMTVTVQDRARLAWSLPLPGKYLNSDVTIGADGTIYVVTFGDNRSNWYAVSSQGAVLWSLDLPDTRSTPAIGADGTLYAGLVAGGLIAVSPGGVVRWTLWDLDVINGSPAIGSDGTIYVAGGRHVYAVDPQGEMEWAFETPEHAFSSSSPAVASDGTIYVGGTADGTLYSINPNGSLRWKFEIGEDNYIYSGPSIDKDGRIYFGALHGLYAVGPDGVGGPPLLDMRVLTTPSIGPDGGVYVTVGWPDGGAGVLALDRGGQRRWTSLPAAFNTPILGADGTVYITGADHRGSTVAALDSQGRLLWDYVVPAGYFWHPSHAIGVDGTILAVTTDPIVLYAIVEKRSTNGGFAGSPWPTARGNRANNGRAGG